MKAFAFLGKNQVGLADKPIPEPGANDAVVKTTASLVCTSDVHTVHGLIPLPEGRVLGHESVGVVHRVGSDVKTVREGQRVTVCAVTPCGRCEFCQRDGNLAEYFLVNDADYNLVPIPERITDEQALYTCDMMSTGFAAAEQAEIPLGGSVAIFAQGPVGLCATAGARLRGAGLVIAVEGRPERQTLAKRFGADVVVDPGAGDPVAKILELTGGLGVDSAIEAVGLPVTFESCIRATRAGGTITNVGYHGEAGADALRIPLAEFGFGMADKTIRGVLCPGGRERMTRLLRVLETARFDPTPMTTHRFRFGEVERAFRMMESKEENILKPLILY